MIKTLALISILSHLSYPSARQFLVLEIADKDGQNREDEHVINCFILIGLFGSFGGTFIVVKRMMWYTYILIM